ncbi:MAG TPA: DegV family protein [Anaerolineaceae bacterium]|nr:DegV family protein [Anaerolineaceae bacterium]
MIQIITDSTCDIPDALIEQYGITIIPHYIIWGEDQYRDRVDMTALDFYNRLAVDPVYPSSSQAGVPDFQRTYEEVAAKGATEIITLTVSSAMSGAYHMACEAAKLVKIPVSVVDGKGPTMSLGWQVLAAARARDAGMDVPDILVMLENLKQKLVQYVAMESLEYLQKSGRIGNAVKWVGSMLKIRPLVSINHKTGLVEPAAMARTHKSLVDTMYKKFFDHLKDHSKLRVAVLHGNALAEAEALAERIRTEFNPVELLINMTGPVLGISTGPGALALCGYAED